MRAVPQPSSYRPDPAIEEIAGWLADAVRPADFPQAILRFRSDRHAATVGLEQVSDEEWTRHFARFVPLEDLAGMLRSKPASFCSPAHVAEMQRALSALASRAAPAGAHA